MRRIHIVPKPDVNLYAEMVAKQNEIAKGGRGTFYRSGRRTRDKAKWGHVNVNGWVNLQRALGNAVIAEVHWNSENDLEWKLLQAFLGFVDRHFSDSVQSVSIHYE